MIRPKSIATVVCAFWLRVSSVMSRSVESTVISLMLRMRVVLPAANGPVTTILAAWPLCLRLRRVVVVVVTVLGLLR